MKFKPLRDHVLVTRIDAEQTTASGIIIPDTAQENPMEGIVIAVGDGKINDDGTHEKMTVQEGNRVIFGKWSGTVIKIDEEEYLILTEDELIGILKEELDQ